MFALSNNEIMTKQIIQRALPLTDTYSVHSFAYVSMIDGNGTCCENCGRLISNMVTLVNQNGNKYIVGNDCADTLTVDKTKMFFEVQPAFTEGKQMRAKIKSAFKKNTIVKAYLYTNKDNVIFLVMQTESGASSMSKICFPTITVEYIKDLLN